MRALPDNDIFSKAIQEERIILTFDFDFGEIAARCRGGRTGVVVFRLHNTRGSHVIERLRDVLAVSTMPLELGAVITVEESRHRVRYFPMESPHD